MIKRATILTTFYLTLALLMIEIFDYHEAIMAAVDFYGLHMGISFRSKENDSRIVMEIRPCERGNTYTGRTGVFWRNPL